MMKQLDEHVMNALRQRTRLGEIEYYELVGELGVARTLKKKFERKRKKRLRKKENDLKNNFREASRWNQ